MVVNVPRRVEQEGKLGQPHELMAALVAPQQLGVAGEWVLCRAPSSDEQLLASKVGLSLETVEQLLEEGLDVNQATGSETR